MTIRDSDARFQGDYVQGKSRIFVVDDHPIVRKGLAQLVAHEADIAICGGTDNVTDAMEQIRGSDPDLVVVDLSLKDSHGLDLLEQIKARLSACGRWSGRCTMKKSTPSGLCGLARWGTSTNRNRSGS